MTYCWVILESDKFVPNMSEAKFTPLKGINKDGQLRILRFGDHDAAYNSLLDSDGAAFNAKNKNKDCTYTIIKIYE